MAFPTGWGRKCKLTIQNGKVPGSLSDFPALLDLTTLPSEMFDADGSYPALNGGGDIRFSSDASGSTQLACEIVTFITDNTPANGEAEIHVKIPSLASATDTDFYVWYNKSGETQPAETDTYGKHNVWNSNFKLVQHMNQDPSGSSPQMIDSTSNSNDGTSAGSMTSGDSITGQVGKGIDLDGTDDGLAIADSTSLDAENITISAWFKASQLTQLQSLIRKGNGSGDDSYTLILNDPADGDIRLYIHDGSWRAGPYKSISIDTMYLVHGTYDGTNLRLYLGGSEVATSPMAYTGACDITTDEMGVGFRPKTIRDRYFKGLIDEVRVSNIARSANWIETEYNNQNDPATFVIEGTPETPGAGTTRNLVAAIANLSALLGIDANVLRPVTSNITNISSTTDIDITLAGVISFIASLANASGLTDADVNIFRPLLSNLTNASSSTDIDTVVSRLLLSNIVNSSSATNTNVVTARTLNVVLSNLSTTTTLDIITQRHLISAVANISDILNIDIVTQRLLVSTLTNVSSTADINITVSGIISFLANIINISDTSFLEITTKRLLAGNIVNSSLATGIDQFIQRALTANLANLSSSSAVDHKIIRDLIAVIVNTSSLTGIDITLAGLISLIATLSNTSAISGIDANVNRPLTSIITNVSTVAGIGSSITRQLLTTLINVSSLSDIDALLKLGLSAAIHNVSAISTIDQIILRNLIANIINTFTTSDIDIITAQLASIIDTTIESLTAIRSIGSLTPERILESGTVLRAILQK